MRGEASSSYQLASSLPAHSPEGSIVTGMDPGLLRPHLVAGFVALLISLSETTWTTSPSEADHATGIRSHL